jgi:hypothetical protein
MKYYFLILPVLLLIGCAAQNARPVEAPQRPADAEKSRPAKVRIETVEELKIAIAQNLTATEKVKIAFSCRGDNVSRKLMTKLISLFPKSFSLELAGLGDLPPEEALPQMDPRTTPSLVYINYIKDGELLVSLYATDGSFSRNLLFDYSYSDAPVSAELSPEHVGEFHIKAMEAICDSAGNVFISDGERVVIAALESKKELFGRQYACPRPQFFNSDGSVSIFCSSSSKGVTFAQKGQLWEEKNVEVFPLPARAERFIYAANDEAGNLSLFDKRDDMLGSFVELCSISSRGTTVFIGISPDGEIWGLRGDLISVMPSVLKGPYAHIASAGQSVFALLKNGGVEQISLDENFAWKTSEIKVKQKAEPSAIAFYNDSVLLFYPEGNVSRLYSIDISSIKPGGE